MRCPECHADVERLTNEHLRACCGLTLHEVAIRQRQPLELLLHADQVNVADDPADYPLLRGVCADERARALLLGLRWAGLLHEHGELTELPGEVRRLELLFWDLEQLQGLGFRFRQTYEYSDDTHRVVARSRLRTRSTNLRRGTPLDAAEPPPDFLPALAAFVAHVAELQAGYLFLPFAVAADGADVAERLRRDHGIACRVLAAADRPGGTLLRSQTRADAQRLLQLLETWLVDIPGAQARFVAATPEATVTKQLVFDAAHFITDHPAKCSNLHGGRYVLEVQVSGRIDPVTGCVVDYGYLKRVVNREVVERFDHHHLNYAAHELAWRSSTEMLCVHIWERLIDFLPGLSGLRLYETTQSWCDYRGPDLETFQQQGGATVLRHFQELVPGARRRAAWQAGAPLRAVSGGRG